MAKTRKRGGSTEQSGNQAPQRITSTLLRGWPLPPPDSNGDKKERGRALIIAGAAELVGTPVLAATAVLRAGAGKVRVATCRSIAPFVGLGIPEARVFPLPETRQGGIAISSARQIGRYLNEAEALLVGPGMIDEEAVTGLMRRLLRLIDQTTLIVDATALKPLISLTEQLRRLDGHLVLTPHADEMAVMMNIERSVVDGQPLQTARQAAEKFNAIVALKGATTYIAAPDGTAFRNTAGNVGLATTGSGDTLAGIITGLCARGASPLHAAVWGVYLHAKAGERLAKAVAPLGYLAREIPGEIPGLLAKFTSQV